MNNITKFHFTSSHIHYYLLISGTPYTTLFGRGIHMVNKGESIIGQCRQEDNKNRTFSQERKIYHNLKLMNLEKMVHDWAAHGVPILK